MKPINFPGVNRVFGANQPEYQPLPALLLPDPEGTMITCWELTDEEALEIATNKKIFLKQLTFGGLIQPQLPMASLDGDIQIN